MSEKLYSFSDMSVRRAPLLSTVRRILSCLKRQGPGYVFTPGDLLRFGSRAAVDKTLSRLAQTGRIRRLDRGLYDVPKVSVRLGMLAPTPDRIAAALGRQTGSVVQPTSARAANAVGLSTQVPARAVYLTNGTSRRRVVGSQTIELRRAAPRQLLGAGSTAGAVIQALRYLGQRGVTKATAQRLAATLSTSDKRALAGLAPAAPAWMRTVIAQVAGPSPSTTGGRWTKSRG